MPPKSKKSLGKELYGGAAEFGRTYALIGAVFGSLIGGASLVGGAYVMTLRDRHTGEAQGTVLQRISDSCLEPQQQDKVQRPCVYLVKYKPNEKAAAIDVHVNSYSSLKVGSRVSLFFDPKQPHNVEIQQVPYKVIGGIMAVVGLLIVGGVWVEYYLARRYKFYAAAEGTAAGVGLIKRAVS